MNCLTLIGGGQPPGRSRRARAASELSRFAARDPTFPAIK